FQCQQFRIARTRTDAGQDAFGIRRFQSPALANALTAAAVIADPPIRPRTTASGIASGLSIRASFDSAAPTKPTGMPMMAAGRGAPASSISSKRKRAVGALPIATTEPSIPSQRSRAAADRVLPMVLASSIVRLLRSVQITGLSVGRRARVIPWATISASQKMGLPARKALRAFETKSEEK